MNVSVITAEQYCTSSSSEIPITSRRHGYLSPASLAQLSSRLVAMATASAGGGLAGSADCPWTVAVEQGQRINLSLVVLPARTSLTSRRDAFIDMDDDVTNGSVLIPL